MLSSARVVVAACLCAVLTGACGPRIETRDARERRLIEDLRRTSVSARLAAAQELGTLRSRAAVPGLIRTLGDIRDDVRLAAIESLGAIGDRRAVQPLCGMLHGQPWALRKAAADALGAIGDGGAVPALAGLLTGEDASVGATAAINLGRIGGAAVPELVKALGSGKETVRERAAHALGRTGSRAAAPALREALGDAAPVVRIAAGEALVRLHHAPSAPAVVNLLLDDDAAVRGEAFKMVTALGAAAAPTLLELAADLFLADPGEASVSRKIPKQRLPEFSRRVVLLLCQLQDMRAVPALLAAASQRDRGIHGPAKGYLDTLTASERGSSVLVAALQHPVTAVRARALSVLQQRPDNVPLETLTGLLEDASAEIRALAAELIGRAGNAAGIDPLAGMLDDDDPGVRVAAAVALARLKDKRGADILLEALRKGNEDPRALVPVIRAVGWIRERRAFELVRPFLDPKQAKTEACLSAIETAGQLGGPEAREALLPFLKAHVWHSRHARSPLRLACRSLAAMGDPEAFEPLANVVRRKTSDRDYSGVRDAVEGVLKLDPARGVPVVLERLGVCKPYEESILLHLAGALGATGDTRVIEPLLGLTVSDLAKVREAAAEALVEIGGSPGGIAKLVAHMDATTARGRASLSEVLAEMGEPAREPVLEALTAASAKIRQGAAWTLGKRGDRAAVDPLIGRLGDTNQHVRAAAAWALGVLNDRRATGPLLAMLSDPELKPRMGAAEALGSLGATNAVEALVGIARDDTNSTMRAAAVYALGRLGAVKALDAAPTDASAGGTAEP